MVVRCCLWAATRPECGPGDACGARAVEGGAAWTILAGGPGPVFVHVRRLLPAPDPALGRWEGHTTRHLHWRTHPASARRPILSHAFVHTCVTFLFQGSSRRPVNWGVGRGCGRFRRLPSVRPTQCSLGPPFVVPVHSPCPSCALLVRPSGPGADVFRGAIMHPHSHCGVCKPEARCVLCLLFFLCCALFLFSRVMRGFVGFDTAAPCQ